MKTITIEPSHGRVALKLQDLWEYRELVYFLVWRDIKVRYKQTFLGAAWAILQPLLTMIVFSVIFGRLAKIPSDNIPYPLFVFCALLPWQLFAHSLNESSNSLVVNRQLLTKVYFPRLVIPIAAVLAGLLDFFIGFLVLLIMMSAYHMTPTAAIVSLPFFLLLATCTALGVGLWLSALNVQYRDVRYVIPFLIQIWFFSTPVAYPSTLIPEWVRPIYGLNPMAGVVEGFRWALIGKAPVPGCMILISTAVVFLVIIAGLIYFRRMERTFADVI